MNKVYRCGDCPVCSFLGDLVLLEASETGALFVYCPHCGCAFKRPTEGVVEITPPEEYAPRRFALPGRDQVRVAIDRGWRPRFLAMLDDEWKERLGPGFRETVSLRGASGDMCRPAVLLLSLVLGAAGIACGTSGPEACKAAGGSCLIGGSQCSGTVGPQDCNPDRTPAGQYCCLPGAAGQASADAG